MIRVRVTELMARLVVCWFAFFVAFPAQAECLEWNLNGYWEFQLSNGEWYSFDSRKQGVQPSSKIEGWLTHYGSDGKFHSGGGAVLKARGSSFNLDYRDETAGNVWLQRFQGVIDPNGKLSGTVPESYVLVKGHYDKYTPPAILAFYERGGRGAACQKTSAQAEVEQNPEGRVGDVLKETQPPSEKDTLGIEQGPKIGDFLKKP